MASMTIEFEIPDTKTFDRNVFKEQLQSVAQMLLSYLPSKAITDDVVAKEDVLDSVERGLTEMYVALQSGKALKTADDFLNEL